MKAIVKVRVKATGEIKEVTRGIYYPYQYVDNEGTIYTENDVKELPGDDDAIFCDPTIDYWTRLEHQATIGAMQGILSNNELYREICKSRNLEITITEYAHALVERLKNK